MTKRKLHQLIGTINHCFCGQVTSKGPHQNQPFYCLEISTQSLFTKNQKATIYAFPNLVSPEIWNALVQETYQTKKYLFTYEKRTPLRTWNQPNPN